LVVAEEVVIDFTTYDVPGMQLKKAHENKKSH
jgi:hypothetical protein